MTTEDHCFPALLTFFLQELAAILMSILIQSVPVLDQYHPNDLALEEALDTLDPLRHFFKSLDETDSSPNSKADALIPSQPLPTVKEIVQLSFGTHPFRSPISISLAVDASPGCGGIAWPAGQVLAEYIAGLGPEFVKGKTVLELGSGTGLVGLIGAALGAGAVWITDQAPLLDIMSHNVLLNKLTSNVTVSELNWGEPLTDAIPHRPDLILAADCVYYEPTFPLLVQTLSDLVNDEKTEVLFCYKKRRKADKRFFILLKKKFTWAEVMDSPGREVYSREQISLIRLVKRQYA
ncbi:hypothetical protein PILCRDRAFT_818882 [Piloderma croceum F 1598]|uniref:Protein-lysine N-methyltransferase EFM6 n=1 Tax=Piloderma croceum (strain F 1598) TaxID=765440 RepID=A0A0C3BC46_PILCF|nr:hypothetical protein PILCRDRAFT_818882 [Piloderma croceum F 1598]